jgi:acyl carrier protein
MGIRPLSSSVALDALGRLLQSRAAQAVVADVDWATFKPAYELRGHRRLLEHVGPIAASETRQPSASATARATFAALPEADRAAALTDHIRREVAAVMKLPIADLPDTKGFFSLGMDSLMAIELRRRLEASLSLTLPATIAFDAPNINALALNLAARLGESRLKPSPTTPGSPTYVGAGFSPLNATESELQALIARELERLETLVRDR